MYPYKFVFSNEKPQHDKLLCGIIMDEQHNPIKDAIVKIETYESDKNSIYIVTDNDGEFVYGPLKNVDNISVKIWVENICTKKYIINPSNNV